MSLRRRPNDLHDVLSLWCKGGAHMKPETVLGIKYREEPTAKLQEWLKEYAAIAAEFPGAVDLAQRLSKRA